MLYRVALGTGFRTRELRSLTPESFDLDGTTPQITVEAAYSKRRRRDVQTIRADLADELRPWLATKPQNKLIFERMAKATARMLRTDLIKARNKWIAAAVDQEERLQREESDFLRHVDSSGKVLDFHAIRHTYISGIVAGNASVRAGTADPPTRPSDACRLLPQIATTSRRCLHRNADHVYSESVAHTSSGSAWWAGSTSCRGRPERSVPVRRDASRPQHW